VTRQGSAFYSYCSDMDCRSGATGQALRLCQQRNVGDCYIYDIGGHVVWRHDLPAPQRTGTIQAKLTTERGRNVFKVDCSSQLKHSLSEAQRETLGTALGVRNSRVPWTYCDRLVEAAAAGRVTQQQMAAVKDGVASMAELQRLLAQFGTSETPATSG
jgi:hypothetical protein